MRRLGFFDELVGTDACDESMLAAVRSSPDESEAAVVAYLRTGVPVLDVMERRRDVLDATPVAETGSLLTDGTWYWREDLAHYVSKYHLQLSDDFLSHVKAHDFQVPDLDFSLLALVTSGIIEDWQRIGS